MFAQRTLVIGLALAAAGCVQGSGGFLPTGPQYANAQQVYGAVTNFSVVGSASDGSSFCEYHAPNGQLSGRDSQGAYQGTWVVTGNQLCYSLPQRNILNECQNVALQGQQATFYSASGQSNASGNLIGGNVC